MYCYRKYMCIYMCIHTYTHTYMYMYMYIAIYIATRNTCVQGATIGITPHCKPCP